MFVRVSEEEYVPHKWVPNIVAEMTMLDTNLVSWINFLLLFFDQHFYIEDWKVMYNVKN